MTDPSTIRSIHALALLAAHRGEGPTPDPLVEPCELCGVQVVYGSKHVCVAYRDAERLKAHKRTKSEGDLL